MHPPPRPGSKKASGRATGARLLFFIWGGGLFGLGRLGRYFIFYFFNFN